MTLPDLVDNRTFQPKTLADVLNNLLREAGQPQLSVVTAYFNLDAFKVLQHSLTRVTRLRILLGRQQEQEFVLTKRLSEELSETLRRAGTPTSPLNFPRNPSLDRVPSPISCGGPLLSARFPSRKGLFG